MMNNDFFYNANCIAEFETIEPTSEENKIKFKLIIKFSRLLCKNPKGRKQWDWHEQQLQWECKRYELFHGSGH